MLCRNAKLGADFHDRFLGGFACNLDIGLEGQFCLPVRILAATGVTTKDATYWSRFFRPSPRQIRQSRFPIGKITVREEIYSGEV